MNAAASTSTQGDLFKDLAWDSLVNALLMWLFAQAPWLAWGPLRLVTTFVITHLTDKLYSLLDGAADMTRIVFRNEAHQREYERASVRLKILARDKGAESEEFRNARAEHRAALSDLVRFGAA